MASSFANCSYAPDPSAGDANPFNYGERSLLDDRDKRYVLILGFRNSAKPPEHPV